MAQEGRRARVHEEAAHPQRIAWSTESEVAGLRPIGDDEALVRAEEVWLMASLGASPVDSFSPEEAGVERNLVACLAARGKAGDGGDKRQSWWRCSSARWEKPRRGRG
jgi:hypothetical protein